MIIKLPFVLEENNSSKLSFRNFRLEKKDNNITLSGINLDKNFIKVLCLNNYNCIHYLKITLPLELEIIDNKLISDYFFEIACQSLNNYELDFFKNIVNFLNDKLDLHISLCSLNDININLLKYCNKKYVKYKIGKKYDNIDSFLVNTFNFVKINLNAGLLINYLYSNYTQKEIKKNVNFELINKFLNVSNKIKSFKFSFKGSYLFNISEHLNNFNNLIIDNNSVKLNRIYFINIKNDKSDYIKSIKIELKEKLKNKIISYYPLTLKKILNKTNIFNFISKNNLVIESFFNKIFKKSIINNINPIINYLLNNSNKISLEYMIYRIKNLELNFNKIDDKYKHIYQCREKLFLINNLNNKDQIYRDIINEYSDSMENKLKILKRLFSIYTFPIIYNTRKLDNNFIKIIEFSLNNYKMIIKIQNNKIYLTNDIVDIIPIKLKTLYFNIIKTYYQMINNNYDNISYSSKIYEDYIHYEVFKLIFEKDNCINKIFKKDIIKYDKLRKIFEKNIILIQLCKYLKWKNFTSKINYFLELLKNKNLIFFQDRLNKTVISENLDSRIKKLLYNPFDMFKYLFKERDFIKWIKLMKQYINNLYVNSITILKKDYNNLGRLIFLLTNIKEQNLEDSSYLLFIDHCQNHNNLILFKSRINLNIKDNFKFLKVKLNLGFLAKHLTKIDNSNIILPENKDNKNKIEKLKEQIEEISKKYYKYKGKYIQLKRDTITCSSNKNL